MYNNRQLVHWAADSFRAGMAEVSVHPGPQPSEHSGAQTWCEEQKKVWTLLGCREASGPPVDKDVIKLWVYP